MDASALAGSQGNWTAANQIAQNNKGQYIWKDNGIGGVNYYKVVDNGTSSNLVPITREEFAYGTGENVGGIENWVKSNYEQKIGQSTDTTNTTTDNTPNTNNNYTSGTTSTAFKQYFNGVLYTDPEKYKNAVDDTILTNYRNQQKKIDDLYNAGLITLEEKLQSARDNATALKKSRDTSLSTVTGYYNRISPNAVQSAEADVRNNINQDYNTNQSKIGGLFGNKKISELQDEDLTPYMNEISNTGSLARGLRDLKTNRQDYINDNENYRMNATDQTANNMLDYKSGLTPTTSTSDVVSDYLNNINSYFGTDSNAQNSAFTSTSKTTPSYFEGLDEYENK